MDRIGLDASLYHAFSLIGDEGEADGWHVSTK